MWVNNIIISLLKLLENVCKYTKKNMCIFEAMVPLKCI